MSRITPIAVPQWGLEMTEGVISTWHLPLGAACPKGTEIVDIETAKIVNTLEASTPLPGVLRRILAQPGDTLPVGALIGVMAEPDVPEEEIDAWLAGQGGPSTAAEPVPAPAAAATESEAPEVVQEAVVPALATAAPVAPPAVAGPALNPQALREANAAVHASPVARRRANQLGLDLNAVAGSGRHGRVALSDVEALGADRPPVQPVPRPDADTLQHINAKVKASPVARRMALRHGVDLRTVTGTGRHGRVSVRDLLAVLTPEAAAPAAAAEPSLLPMLAGLSAGPAARKRAAALGIDLAALQAGTSLSSGVPGALPTREASDEPDYQDLPLTPMRKAIAANLQQSKQQIPHFYLTLDVCVEALLSLREAINREAAGRRLSVNDFLLRAVALALMEVPDANVHFIDQGIRQFRHVHLSVAVAVDGGLMTPVIRQAERQSVRELGAALATLADQARARRLAAEQLAGGTFTVSNLGMHGIRDFAAVINPPQGAILAVGAVRREWREVAPGAGAFQSVMTLTLSCDHRAIDGAVGATFLAALKRHLEQPHGLLM